MPSTKAVGSAAEDPAYAGPEGRHGFREEVASTKAVGSAAEDPAHAGPEGRHGFREEVASMWEGEKRSVWLTSEERDAICAS